MTELRIHVKKGAQHTIVLACMHMGNRAHGNHQLLPASGWKQDFFLVTGRACPGEAGQGIMAHDEPASKCHQLHKLGNGP